MQSVRATPDQQAASASQKLRRMPSVAQLGAAALFFGIGVVVSPCCWVLHKVAGEAIPPRCGQVLLQRLFRFFVWYLRVTGVLRLDSGELHRLSTLQRTIVVSNHPSLLDAVILIALLPPCACVMRASLLRHPALGGCAVLAGFVTNDSGSAFVRQGIRKVENEGNLLIFPEGTRTVTPPLNRLKNGFAMVAVKTGAPVQTVLIDYPGRYLSKGTSLFDPVRLPLDFRIRLGEKFYPAPNEMPSDFGGRIQEWMRSALRSSHKTR